MPGTRRQFLRCPAPAQFAEGLGLPGPHRETKALRHVRAKGLPVRVVHLAAGDGRHVMDSMQKFAAAPDSVVGCEPAFELIAQGRALARPCNLDRIVRFVLPQTADSQQIASLAPPMTIAIVPLHACDEEAPLRGDTVSSQSGLAAGMLVELDDSMHRASRH